MVARTRTEGELVVIFSRDGERDDARVVQNGERAAKVAILMIASRDALRAGDQLLVQRYDAVRGDDQRNTRTLTVADAHAVTDRLPRHHRLGSDRALSAKLVP